MNDATLITIAIIFCLSGIVMTILVVWSKNRKKDSLTKMNPVMSGFLLVALFLILSFIAELTNILEKGWTSQHLYIFAIIFLLWIGMQVISFFLNKIKPFEYRYKKALSFLKEQFSGQQIVEVNKHSTFKDCSIYNKSFLYGDDGKPRAVDVFLFHLKTPNLTSIIILQDLITCDVQRFYYNPAEDIIKNWMSMPSVNMDSVNENNKKEEDDDNLEVNKN